MSDLRIAAEGVAQLDSFLELVEEAAAWLWERGIRQWEPGTNRGQRAHLAKLIDHGALVIARHDVESAGAQRAAGERSRPVGGCILSARAPGAWGARGAANALYLSKLVVARSCARSGVAAGVLRFCEGFARDGGRTYLRLDCWDGNARLRAYYRNAGFTELDAAREHGYAVRLFEKHL